MSPKRIADLKVRVSSKCASAEGIDACNGALVKQMLEIDVISITKHCVRSRNARDRAACGS
jgi:hypothetical protein